MRSVNREFWKGRRVFLTGHTGFKGSWLSLWLQEMGADLTGYALSPVDDLSLFQDARIEEGMSSKIGDLRKRASLEAAIRESEPEVVLHLAAQPLVRKSYAEPIETFESNVLGTAYLLEALRSCPTVRSIVVVSSDKCYQNREQEEGYREEDALGGSDPYSASKGCCEIVAASYRSSFWATESDGHEVGLGSARAGNVIGGGDWSEDRLVPDAVRAFTKEEPVGIRYPDATRPWQFVLEPLHGYLLLAESLYENRRSFAEGWNFGPPEESCQPVGKLMDEFSRQWGEGASWFHDGGEHLKEHRLLTLDCSKARAYLDWRPVLDFGETLDWTCDWYRKRAEGGDPRELTLTQLREYEMRLGVGKPAALA